MCVGNVPVKGSKAGNWRYWPRNKVDRTKNQLFVFSPPWIMFFWAVRCEDKEGFPGLRWTQNVACQAPAPPVTMTVSHAPIETNVFRIFFLLLSIRPNTLWQDVVLMNRCGDETDIQTGNFPRGLCAFLRRIKFLVIFKGIFVLINQAHYQLISLKKMLISSSHSMRFFSSLFQQPRADDSKLNSNRFVSHKRRNF